MDRCKSKTTEMHENEELKDFYGLKPVRFIKAESAGHGFASNDFNPIVGAFHGDVLPDAGPEEIELFFFIKTLSGIPIFTNIRIHPFSSDSWEIRPS